MREGTIRILTFAAVLLLSGVHAAAEGVWISDTGEKHEVGAHAIFLEEGRDTFDLSDLEDGETRVFGSGDKQFTATRNGDTVTIDRPEGGDERALHIECEIGRDTCRVMTYGEDSEKVALMIKKRHPGHHIVTIDEDVTVGDDGEATIVIKHVGTCEDEGEAGCLAHEIEMLGDAVHAGEMVVEVVASADGGGVHKNVWITTDAPHHRHAKMITEGGTKHDLSELYDGETRIFGIGEKQVTAVRDGDEITVTRPARDGSDDVLVTCQAGRDGCYVLTDDDDPEPVVVMISRPGGCEGAGEECDADLLRLRVKDVEGGNLEVIELHGGASGDIYVADPGGEHKTFRRLKIVREEDD